MLANLRAELESRIQYTFQDPRWLEQAMTHSSRHGDSHAPGNPASNERLELLGDAVLGLVITDRLTQAFANWNLGRLNRAKAHLVSAEMLSTVARRVDLGRFLQLGPGEERTGGREKPNLLADAYEAVVAAIFRDGGLEAADGFVLRTLWEPALADGLEALGEPDAKTALQERLREMRLDPGEYRLVGLTGPEHERVFEVEFRMNGKSLAAAQGRSKKQAELAAARLALEFLASSPTMEN